MRIGAFLKILNKQHLPSLHYGNYNTQTREVQGYFNILLEIDYVSLLYYCLCVRMSMVFRFMILMVMSVILRIIRMGVRMRIIRMIM